MDVLRVVRRDSLSLLAPPARDPHLLACLGGIEVEGNQGGEEIEESQVGLPEDIAEKAVIVIEDPDRPVPDDQGNAYSRPYYFLGCRAALVQRVYLEDAPLPRLDHVF